MIGADWRVIVEIYLAIFAIILVFHSAFSSAAEDARCRVSAPLLYDDSRLNAVSRAIRLRRPITIVTLGSSSTEGIGASKAANTYPAVLKRLLAGRINRPVSVLNLGVGGEIISQTYARIRPEVLPLKPTLVIWQVGTNDLLRREALSKFDSVLTRGIRLLRDHGIDIILMDLQVSPREKDPRELSQYLSAIDTIGDRYDLPVLHRYEIMDYWILSGELSSSRLLINA